MSDTTTSNEAERAILRGRLFASKGKIVTVSNKPRIRTLDRVRTPEGIALLYDYANGIFEKFHYHAPRGFDKEDMVQAGLESVFTHLDKFDPHGGLNIDAWCTSHIRYGFGRFIIQNTWEKSRSQNTQYIIEGRTQTYFGEDEKGASEVEVVTAPTDAELIDAEMDDLLSVLTDNQRFVIERMMEGFNQREIGEMVGVTNQTVSHRVTASIQKLGLSDYRHKPLPPPTQDEIEQWAQEYESGTSLRGLQAKYGRSWATIGSYLVGHGATLRPNMRDRYRARSQASRSSC